MDVRFGIPTHPVAEVLKRPKCWIRFRVAEQHQTVPVLQQVIRGVTAVTRKGADLVEDVARLSARFLEDLFEGRGRKRTALGMNRKQQSTSGSLGRL